MNRKSRVLRLVVLILVVFPLLGCVSMSYFIDMEADASGKGTIYHSITVPDIGSKGASGADSYISQLSSEGWENIEVSSPGSNQIKVSATYRLDHEAGRGMPTSLKNFSITVEESEIGYRHFNFQGKYDFTKLQEVWTAYQDTDDPSFEFDMRQLFSDIGEEEAIITKNEIDEMVRQFGEPSIEYKIRLPGNTPVDAKGLWSNREDYLNGKTDTIAFTWKPGKKTTGDLTVSRRWESKPSAAPEQMASNLNQLTQEYMGEIPYGAAINILEMPTGGWFNNIIFANIFGEGRTCGSYQNFVMDFLDGVRTNPDPNVRNMLAGYDYGPIQTNGGGHVAVVVFPTGSDWTKTGTVYDPWPTQRPVVYDINTWFVSLGFYAYSGYYPEPSYGMETAYPHLTGKPSSYPAQGDLNRKTAQPVKQILVINSPVTVMIETEDGRQVGVMPNSAGMNQAPQDVSFYTLPKEDGGHSWFFMLPDQAADVTVYGQEEGTVHIALVTEDKIVSYGAQLFLNLKLPHSQLTRVQIWGRSNSKAARQRRQLKSRGMIFPVRWAFLNLNFLPNLLPCWQKQVILPLKTKAIMAGVTNR
ncbi:MAG: hypothetical protein AB9891_13660 [Anaerolineaceae bacterium]